MRSVRIAIAGTALVATLGATASAAPATHLVYLEDYDDVTSFAAGEGPCVPYAGTVHEIRHGAYKLLVNGSDPHANEVKVAGTVEGSLAVSPTVPGDGPTYSGGYREQSTGWLADPDNDQWRVGQYRLIGRLTGSDGSTLRLYAREKVTVRPDGVNVVERYALSCQ